MTKFEVRYCTNGKWATSYDGENYDIAKNAMEIHREAEQTANLYQYANGKWTTLDRYYSFSLSNLTMGNRLEDEEEITYSIPTFTVEDTNRTTVHLTRRDYFAGQALLHGLVFTRYDFKPEEAAERAFKYADAMIEESNK